MRPLTAAIVVAVATCCLGSAGCARRVEPDAYGNVEATDVVVGAETTGRLLTFPIVEGQALAAQAPAGTIDQTQLGFQRDQVLAQREASSSRVREIAAQLDVLQAQRAAATAQRDGARAQRAALVAQQEIAHRAHERAQRLFAQKAATAQQLDQAERDDRVLDEQLKAQDEQVNAQEQQIAAITQQLAATRAQRQTALSQVSSAEAQVAQAGERILRSQITNPIAGTVLATYVEAGEMVQHGQPLYKIANLESVEVRAYVGEPQLAQLLLGQDARVTVDAGRDQRQSLTGTVSWISSQAEFTPTPIQTRDERADLVYAIKIKVPNQQGLLKIGMPADVQFTPPGSGQ